MRNRPNATLTYRASCTALLALACLRCGSSSANDKGSAPASGNGSFGGSSASQSPTSPGSNLGAELPNAATGGASSSSGGAAPVIVPPEKVERSFLAPVVTGKYVFSANPKSGRVAVIDAETYGVRLFNAGFGPKYLTAIPGGKGAIVINELSHDTTLFRFAGDDVSVAGANLPVHEGANAWSVSPDGRFAIAWTQTDPAATLDPTGGSQDISVLDLEQLKPTRLSVGFHPTQVTLDSTSEHAFVVNDEGVSVVTLGEKPTLSLLAHVSDDPLEEPAARDVSIVPDGTLAVVRVDGSSQLRVVDLAHDTRVLYDLGAPISDVNLSKDGKLAIAALPGLGQVVLVPVPPTGDAASFERVAIPGEVTSSVAISDDSEIALLFQNSEAAHNSHLTILDLRPAKQRALRTVDVKGPVDQAFTAPGAASAIVFQRPIAGSNKLGLFSGVPTLERRSAKIVGTDAQPSDRAFSKDGAFALVTVGSEQSAVHGVYCVRLDTLQTDFVELASPPSPGATGIVEQVGRGFVAQSHPEGRITFIDLQTAKAHTITGFELAARILQ
jgi:DNA-binding beta-propeller fold protein YncE